MPKSSLYLLLSGLFVLAVLASLSSGGRSDVGLNELFGVFNGSNSALANTVMIDIRFPRTVVAALIGICLGLSGLILQAVTRNPLASPSILGINQGAALGLVATLVFPQAAAIGVGFLSVTGAIVAGGLTFIIAGGLQGKLNSLRLILGGITVGAFAYAFARFALTLDDDVASAVLQWSAGNVGDVRWPDAQLLIVWSVLGMVITLLLSHRFNLLALGDSSAQGLGADPRVTLLIGTLLAAVLAGVCVSIAGPIAFVGIVIPHVCRYLFGLDYRVLVGAVSLTGATLMVVGDALSKWMGGPSEMPIGVVVALIGAPYFLYQTFMEKDLG